ncbi:DUF2853 family protein [Granulosicoccus sp.]|jgi:hypothetical protein|nr:DUF2853 family protein [Granulosicoccus sp.]MDB4224818.1 DUF2853 family protein [Granulosicoccus sp.]
MTDYAVDVAKFVDSPNQTGIDNIVKYCGIALRSSRDAALVSSSDKAELNRVRDGFAKKKLDLDTDAADEGIKKVCEQMKGVKQKSRVTFYYLLAEATGTMDKIS